MSEQPLEIPFTLKEKILSLKEKLETNNPGYATVLAEIHAITKANPGYVYALSDEEFQTIVTQGLGRYTQISLEAEKKNKKMTAKEGMSLSEDSV